MSLYYLYDTCFFVTEMTANSRKVDIYQRFFVECVRCCQRQVACHPWSLRSLRERSERASWGGMTGARGPFRSIPSSTDACAVGNDRGRESRSARLSLSAGNAYVTALFDKSLALFAL